MVRVLYFKNISCGTFYLFMGGDIMTSFLFIIDKNVIYFFSSLVDRLMTSFFPPQ